MSTLWPVIDVHPYKLIFRNFPSQDILIPFLFSAIKFSEKFHPTQAFKIYILFA